MGDLKKGAVFVAEAFIMTKRRHLESGNFRYGGKHCLACVRQLQGVDVSITIVKPSCFASFIIFFLHVPGSNVILLSSYTG